jgi:hypothetical protein
MCLIATPTLLMDHIELIQVGLTAKLALELLLVRC